ncbi:MAG TPA: hypothetical protein VF147_03605 [Vicinamibacterales bacterium]
MNYGMCPGTFSPAVETLQKLSDRMEHSADELFADSNGKLSSVEIVLTFHDGTKRAIRRSAAPLPGPLL